MRKKIFLLIFFLLVFPCAAFAQEGYQLDIFKIIWGTEVYSVFPEGYPTAYNVLQYLLFPFFALWLVIFGFFEELRIFRRRTSIQGVLALFIAFIASSSGGLVILVRWTSAALGGWAWLAFFVLMFLGIFMYTGARLTEWGVFGRAGKEYFREARRVFALERQISEYEDRIRLLQSMPGTEEAQLAILKEIEKLRKEVADIKERMEKEAKEQAGKPLSRLYE